MPVFQGYSLYYGHNVANTLKEICPPDVNLVFDVDTHWTTGEGVVRFAPVFSSDQGPIERACWVSYVVGNKLMITLGDRSNFHHYKHDYITPHIDFNMDGVWLDPIISESKKEFDYELAAKIIISWIVSGVKLNKG